MKKTYSILPYIYALLLIFSSVHFGQTKIMPLGDSITEGIDYLFINMAENEGYRKFLKDSLIAGGYSTDFVGSEINGTAGFSDKEHEGHPAWKATETIGGTFAGGGISKVVKGFLAATPAEIVLLHIGTNDISFDWSSSDVADHVNDVESIIDSIHDHDSNIIIILAQIVNRADSGSNRTEPNNDNFFARVAATSEFNDSLTSRFTGRTNVRIVNMEDALIYPDDINTDDTGSWWLHPTADGYRKMAAVWYEELKFVLDNILPVELSSFSGIATKSGVSLNWSTATEVNNYGFEIERALFLKNGNTRSKTEVWKNVGFVEGAGNSNSPKFYSFIDKSNQSGTKIKYRLKQIDIDGSFEYSDEIEVVLSPVEFELAQNYPNPFNPSTTISYSIPQNGFVNISLFNLLGEKVLTIVNEGKEAGNHKISLNGNKLSSGTYFYKLTVGDYSAVKKLVLVK